MAVALLTLACEHVVPRYRVDHPDLLRGCSLRCPVCAALRTVVGVGSPRPAGEAPTGATDRHEHHRKVVVIDADNQTTSRRIPASRTPS